MVDNFIGRTINRYTLKNLMVAIPMLCCLILISPIQAQNSAPHLISNSHLATAGNFTLSWEVDAERVELQEAADSNFLDPATIYIGPDKATAISGKSDGVFYYRIRASEALQTGPWSQPVTVTVSHHPLSRAFLFLALGIVVFIATVVMIIRGARQPA